MKKKKLHGLSLNKKSIANFDTVVGGNIVTGPSNYKGCVDSFNICIDDSALCYISAQCVTLIECPTLADCPFTGSIPNVCC